jgi:cyclic beta-1,2-glucan synthetase
MAAVEERLIDRRGQLHRLFTPPFRDSEPDPGYIRSYPAGVRENGGQYTHGVIWTIFALAKLNKQDKAGALMHLLNPINHALTADAAELYRTEPYVLAADVYAEEPHVGRGGWTWYTGSSGWFYRAGLEAILGVRREGMSLVIDPCLPPEWQFAEVHYDLRSAGLGVYEIVMEASGAAPRSTVSLQLDGSEMLDVTRLPLSADSATHKVRVILRGSDPAATSQPS